MTGPAVSCFHPPVMMPPAPQAPAPEWTAQVGTLWAAQLAAHNPLARDFAGVPGLDITDLGGGLIGFSAGVLEALASAYVAADDGHITWDDETSPRMWLGTGLRDSVPVTRV